MKGKKPSNNNNLVKYQTEQNNNQNQSAQNIKSEFKDEIL